MLLYKTDILKQDNHLHNNDNGTATDMLGPSIRRFITQLECHGAPLTERGSTAVTYCALRDGPGQGYQEDLIDSLH